MQLMYLIFLVSSKSASTLMDESGCRMDHPVASKFRDHVMNGDWAKANSDLQQLKSLLENPESLLVSYKLKIHAYSLFGNVSYRASCFVGNAISASRAEVFRTVGRGKCDRRTFNTTSRIDPTQSQDDESASVICLHNVCYCGGSARTGSLEWKGFPCATYGAFAAVPSSFNYAPSKKAVSAWHLRPPRQNANRHTPPHFIFYCLTCSDALLKQAVDWQTERCPYHNSAASSWNDDLSLEIGRAHV